MPEGYDAIPASEEHIAISNILGTIDGIYNVYAGLLRDAKTIKYTITDKCVGCLLCGHVCPVHAITPGKITIKPGRNCKVEDIKL